MTTIESTPGGTMPTDRHSARMAMTLHADRLMFALLNPLAPDDEGRLRVTEIPLSPRQLTRLPEVAALEEAVYNHPSMLGDYGRIDVAIASHEFFPSPLMPDGMAGCVAGMILPPDDSAVIVETADMIADAAIVMRIPADLDAFIRRTFNTPRYHHPLAMVARCYSVDTATPSPVINLHFLDDGSIYMIARQEGRLLLANRYDTKAATDVVYYALAALEAIGLRPADVRVRTSGNAHHRQNSIDLLNRTFDDVAPASLPTALLREGTAAVALPVELSTLLFL